ncbi:hypothetical protein LJR289_001886 [Pseudoduganella sp. LjRoot289]|uniref:hypothetical protein n=1 Tax=Pseudoduganella sp. LjRoot289 TaxID=3342314 RepID=UPI003ECF25CC
MEFRHAYTLINQAVCAFNEIKDHATKRKMAEAIVILLEVVPTLLANKVDTDSFAKFIEQVKTDIDSIRVFAFVSSLEGILTPKANPICLKNSNHVNCGGPPSRQSRCDLCGKSGKI